jgi:transmembrane sensor
MPQDAKSRPDVTGDHDRSAVDEAAQWHRRLQSRSVSVDELTEFHNWRREPANAEAYAAIERSWENDAGLSLDSDIRRELNGHWRRVHWHLLLAKWRLQIVSCPARVAAGLVAILLISGLAAVWLLAGPRYRTATGEQLAVNLADGTRVHLNTQTSLRVAYSAGERKILLSNGEAFFDVTHDPARPFWVVADGVRVRAIGTAFDVRRDGDHVRVLLVRGRIAVWHPSPAGSAETDMTPGERFDSQTAVTPDRADVMAATSWLDGRLVFNDTPLSIAIAEVNRYNPKPIKLDAPAFAAERISGTFVTGNSDAFVAAVTAVLGLKASTSVDAVTLHAS